MGLFNKLFGSKKKDEKPSNTPQEMRDSYNIMTNITLESASKYSDTNAYKLVTNGIYEDLNDDDDAKYRMTISYELIDNTTNNQYPLEDILDKYLMHVSDFLESENDDNPNTFKLELGGYLDRMTTAQELIGKRVFNRDVKGENGQVQVELVIE